MSLLVLPLALPLFLLGCLLVGLTSKGPILFYQTRIGLHNRPFQLIKIRSIRADFGKEPGAQHTHNDITAVGRTLRKFRLDELPQIWNILRGEMSWVGPRPEVPYYFEHYSKLHPEYVQRQWVRPGITGPAQLNNPNATPNENLEKLTFDLQYVREATFLTDLRILTQSFLFVWK
jgi:lipopolysaccharide/colanic/teichoic acid biosynthesis glycosyltransferase